MKPEREPDGESLRADCGTATHQVIIAQDVVLFEGFGYRILRFPILRICEVICRMDGKRMDFRNPLALCDLAGQCLPNQGGLAELVDALDSKSSSNECGFESHSRYFFDSPCSSRHIRHTQLS